MFQLVGNNIENKKKRASNFPPFVVELGAALFATLGGSGQRCMEVVNDPESHLRSIFPPNLARQHFTRWAKMSKERKEKPKKRSAEEAAKCESRMLLKGDTRVRVITVILALCKSGTVPVTSTILRPIIKGVITANGESSLLHDNGGKF